MLALIDALASRFSEGEPQLRELRIVKMSDQDGNDVVANLLLLLLSFHGLQKLHI